MDTATLDGHVEEIQYVGNVQHAALHDITLQDIQDIGFVRGLKSKHFLWDSEFDKALEAVAPARDTIWGQLRAAEVLLWQYMTDESDENKIKAAQALDQCFVMAQGVAAATEPQSFLGSVFFKAPDMPLRPSLFAHAKSIMSFALLGRSFLRFKDRSFVSGAYNLRKSWKMFQESLALQKALPDEQRDQPVLSDILEFGFGFFQLTLSLVPPRFKWLTELLGFESNRDAGIASLTSCYDRGGPNSVEAGILLSFIRNMFLSDTQGGLSMLEELLSQHPNSIYLALTLGGMQKNSGNLERAIELQRACVARAKELDNSQLHVSCQYSLGDSLFLDLKFEESLELHAAFLEHTKKINFKAMACFKLGYCLWKTGRRDEIPALYAKIGEYVRTGESWDRHAQRRIADFTRLNNEFPPALEMLIDAQWLVEGFQFERALQTLGAEPPATENLNHQALWCYLRGVSLFKQSDARPQEAKQLLLHVVELEPQQETWVVPYAMLHLSEILAEGDPELSKRFLAQAEGVSEKFDFDGRLRLLIKRRKGL